MKFTAADTERIKRNAQQKSIISQTAIQSASTMLAKQFIRERLAKRTSLRELKEEQNGEKK